MGNRTYLQIVAVPPSVDLPIYDEVDVLVAGGGPAGVAAAETAAAHGQNTLLVEAYGFLGGQAVAGYSGTICGMYYGSDHAAEEDPKQCVFGWTEKFCREMQKNNGLTKPQLYGKTFLVPHDPQIWKEVAEGMLLQSGARILYHTKVVGVIKEGAVFKGLVIDTKSGLAQIRAKAIIDATGDADVAYRSGLPFTMGNNGAIQNPTMIFRLGGVNVPEFLKYWGEDTISPEKVSEKISSLKKEYGDLPRAKIWVYYTTRPNELFMNVTAIYGRDGRALNVCDPDDHTEAEIVARKQVRDYARFFVDNIPGCENSFVNDLSAEVGIRQTRSIVGIDRLKNDDVASGRKRTDGIAKCPWPIELHNGEKPYMYWLINDYYEIPYGALVPIEGENIIAAGRNLSAEHQALASARVTAQCFQYGHAAGLAADLMLRKNIRFRDIHGEEIRHLLNEEGARL